MTLALRLAFRSLRRTGGVTVVMIAALALGIGTWYTQHQAFAFLEGKAPVAAPGVYHVALERDEPQGPRGRPQLVVPIVHTLLLTPHDAQALVAQTTARHALTFGAPGLAEPANAPAEAVRVRYATPDLFFLFEIPLVAGRTYARDDAHTDEIVVDEHLADRWFGSPTRAVGATLVLDGETFHVVGVVAARYHDRYAMYERFVPEPAAVYVPLSRAHVEADFRHVIAGGETGYLSTWVELPTVADRVDLIAHVTAYLAAEHARGRHAAPYAVTLRDADEMRRMFEPGGTINMWPLLTAMCLITCIVNLVRMLMVKLGGRRHDLGLLRAFGARRSGVMGQLLLEASLIGALAGICGVVVGIAMMPLAITTLQATPAGFTSSPSIISLDVVFMTIIGSIVAAVVATLYPAWLLARGTPAVQLGRT